MANHITWWLVLHDAALLGIACQLGFMINMSVISYYEPVTILTLNNGNAALLVAFGMLAIALLVLGLRHVLIDEQWVLPEKLVKVSF
jgi:nitric oxide reductase subunit B